MRSHGYALIAALVIASISAPVAALDNKKAAASMASQAAQAYENGDFTRAATLYATAFQTDPQAAYLFAQARSEQLAGDLKGATTHFKSFVGLADADPDRVAKANAFLTESKRVELDKQVAEGESAARAGNTALAVQLWTAVADGAPDRVELYYRIGVLLERAGDGKGAVGAYDKYLAVAGTGAEHRAEAKLRRGALASKAAQPVGGAGASVRDATTSGAQAVTLSAPGGTRQPVAIAPWIVVGGGGALALTGLGIYLATRGKIDTYNASVARDNQGFAAGTTYDAALAEYQVIHTREIVATALAATGVAAIGAGLVWALGAEPSPRTPTASTDGRQVTLSWRF